MEEKTYNSGGFTGVGKIAPPPALPARHVETLLRPSLDISRINTELITAMVNAQSEFPVIGKDTEGQAGSRKYLYATLDNIIEGVKPILKEHGLSVMQAVHGDDNNSVYMTIIVSHVSGGMILSSVPIRWDKDPKQRGIEITYMRRYILSSILAIATEEDTDAGNKPDAGQNRRTSSPKPQKRRIAGGAEAFKGMDRVLASELVEVVKASGKYGSEYAVISMMADNPIIQKAMPDYTPSKPMRPETAVSIYKWLIERADEHNKKVKQASDQIIKNGNDMSLQDVAQFVVAIVDPDDEESMVNMVIDNIREHRKELLPGYDNPIQLDSTVSSTAAAGLVRSLCKLT